MFLLQSRSIKKIKNLKGKRVLLRADYNVPISEAGEVEETFRVDMSLPTIAYLTSRGAKVIIISHIGSDGEPSLEPVVRYLNKTIDAIFFPDWDNLFHIENLKNGQVAVLENLRRNDGEMTNELSFAKKLASLADIYVNDAFSVSHREQASILGVAKLLPSYFGLLFETEYENLSKAFKPAHPFLFILGGLKFKTKIPLLKKFLGLADKIFVGGALANSFYKKLGYEIGRSMVDSDQAGMMEFLKSKKFNLPLDVVVDPVRGRPAFGTATAALGRLASNGVNHNGEAQVRQPEQIKPSDIISDVGPDTVDSLTTDIKTAKFILWNGPLGNCEQGYNKATLNIARAIAESRAFSIVGGGDTVAAIASLPKFSEGKLRQASLDLDKKFGFVSTAGGAMLDFLATGTLPGIEAIRKSRKR